MAHRAPRVEVQVSGVENPARRRLETSEQEAQPHDHEGDIRYRHEDSSLPGKQSGQATQSDNGIAQMLDDITGDHNVECGLGQPVDGLDVAFVEGGVVPARERGRCGIAFDADDGVAVTSEQGAEITGGRTHVENTNGLRPHPIRKDTVGRVGEILQYVPSEGGVRHDRNHTTCPRALSPSLPRVLLGRRALTAIPFASAGPRAFVGNEFACGSVMAVRKGPLARVLHVRLPRMWKHGATRGVVLAAIALAACTRRPSGLASVGGRVITLEKLNAVVETQTGRPIREVTGELVAALFEDYLAEEVVLAASQAPADRDLTGPVRTARARDLLFSLCPPPPPPSEGDVDARLAKLGQTTTGGERVRLRQLILPDQSTARAARERARRGESFEVLSRELSRAPNAAAGGQIGWVERGQLPPEFEAAVFGLGPGDFSEPVASNAGWHLFQLMERRTAGAAADPSARERVRAELGAELAEVGRQACIRELAARVGAQVSCQDAGFPCRNPFEAKP
jgi:PPIC-type PPIASE domain